MIRGRSRLTRSVWAGWLVLVVLSTLPASGRRPRVPSDVRYEQRYREVLELLVRGEEETAAVALGRLDAEVLGREIRDPYRALEGEKLRIAEALIKAEPAAGLALGALHQRAYSDHVGAGSYQLAAHSRQVAAGVVDLVIRHAGGTSGSRAALLMVSLGGRAHEAHQWSVAQELYSDALSLDPSIEAAWLGLAVIQEKRGSYRSAVASLNALQSLPKPPPETQLRLAINLLRTGRREDGRHTLARVARAPSLPAWIRSVAFQELAHDLLDGGAAHDAKLLLLEARERDPCDVALSVQLAYVEERTGTPPSVSGLLVPDCGDSRLTSRSRYNQFPGESFADLDAELAEAAEAARSQLARALQKRRRFSW